MHTITRDTKETKITASLDIYGNGEFSGGTQIGFFDHMLCALTKHASWSLQLACKGDLEVDFHHSVEDCGIVLGKLLAQNLYPLANVERFGNAACVMDEACVECDLDLSNRPFLVFSVAPQGEVNLNGKVGEFDCELVEEFFRAVVVNAGISAHIVAKRGKNKHHLIEASFKAFALAMRRACAKNAALGVPSTKGVL